MSMSNSSPKVSICVVTYNQEKYLRGCLESLVSQQTDFEFEVIVSDDCSTDGTRRIIEEFADRYPGLVCPHFQEENVGAYRNFVHVHSLARGEYVAHMDGDDYALPGKLRAQSEFLDTHRDCNIVFHRVRVLYEKEGKFVDDLTDVKKIPVGGYTRAAILRHISVGANSSKMYRSSARVTEYPPFNIVDYFENVEQVGGGRACYVSDQPFGVYRANVGIASSGSGTRLALCNCFLYFATKYPENRKHVNAAALLLMLADLKNLRPTWRNFFRVWLSTFHLLAPFELIRNRAITKMLRLPSRPN
jgi:glycosyltransferase involved in cell wall biosynthesis